MSDLKVSKGQPVTADKWNRVVDRLPSTIQGFGVGGSGVVRAEVRIKNDSGSDRDLGELLVIDDYDGPDGDSVYQIPKAIEFSCIDPVWHTKISNLVVLAEPIPDGGRGQAVLSGLCVVKLSDDTEDQDFVMIDPENLNECLPSSGGIGRLLQMVGETHAIVNFRDASNLFRYELTEASQAPDDTDAKLLRLDGTELSNAITLSDPEEMTEGKGSGYKGFCLLIGNKFHDIAGPC